MNNNLNKEVASMKMKGNNVLEFDLTPTKIEDHKGNLIKTYKVEDIELHLDDLKNGVEILWKSKDTKFELWFPKEWSSKIFHPSESGSPKSSRKERLKIKFKGNLKIEPGGEKWVYYSIFCSTTKSMAVGNSSPRMIIRK